MRTSDLRVRIGIAGLGLVLSMALGAMAHGAGKATFPSPEAAYEQGIEAYRSGHYAQAIAALEFAAARNVFLATFYLARIYSDDSSAYTDHAKAYRLYRRIGDDYADIDPDDDQRAPFVAKALTALAIYVKEGSPDVERNPDPERAAEYLKHAATFFNDEDAQFELAKLYLNGEGVPKDPRYALHWLSVLTKERRHAGAQAFLAELYWRGRFVKRDALTAYLLSTVAVENAAPSERVWIEDIYQSIFCSTPGSVREEAQAKMADWRRRYGRSVDTIDRSGLGTLQPRAVRVCSNGEVVTPLERSTATPSPAARPPTMQGGMLGFTLKDAGVTSEGPARPR